jgi:predicted oxidoreductase
LATKGAPRHFRRADVLRAADQSMRRLDIDCIGLYRLHEPSSAIPIEETMDAMEELGEAGKARFIGVSNLSVVQMRSAPAGLRKQRLVTRQVRYNLVDCTILATLAFSSPDLELRKMPDRPWFRRSGMFQRAAFLPAWPVLRAHLTVSPGRGSNAAVVGRLADR